MKYLYFAFSLVLLFNSCKENSENKVALNLSEHFKDDSLHFEIKYPKTWEILNSNNETNSITISEKIKDSADMYQENISVWMEQMPLPISDSTYAIASHTQLKLSNPKIDLSPLEKTVINNQTFYTFHFDFVTTDTTKYAVIGYITTHGQRGYNFACTSIKNEMPNYEPIFKEILSTFTQT